MEASFVRLIALLVPLAVILQACSSLSNADLYPYKDHVLLIHRDGKALRLPGLPTNEAFNVDEQISGEYLTRQLETTMKPKLIDYAKHQDKSLCGETLRILIFVHGGLNDYESSAEHMFALFGQTGNKSVGENLFRYPLRESCYYPIFINWNSSLGDSVWDDLFRIRFGEARWWAGLTAPTMIVARLLGSIMYLPVSVIHNFNNVADAVAGAQIEGDPPLAIAGDVLLYLPLQAAYTVTIPWGEGFGAPGWEIMKRRVDLAVAPRLEKTKDQEGAALTLIKQLRNWLKVKNGATVLDCGKLEEECPEMSVEFTIVGHSMGSMLIDHFLESTEANGGPIPTLPIRNIVYLAPATTINATEHFLIPYMARHSRTEFWLFVLNQRDEAREIARKGEAFLFPRGSLLKWIDTFLETEESRGQATFGAVANLRAYYQEEFVFRQKTSLGNYLRRMWNSTNDKSQSWRELKYNWPFQDGDRLHVFESGRQVWLNDYPDVHASFTQPRFFQMVMCIVDENAFPRSAC